MYYLLFLVYNTGILTVSVVFRVQGSGSLVCL